jgi:hypothetical protein
MFDDLDEQGEELLGSLHLGPAEEEPARRGAASRANSVRFDESALHGSSWAGHNNRHSGDFAPARPGSGLMMERSSSHKSDGRHSSAGHSVHSHYSAHSGRASSLGLDTNFAVDDDDDSLDIPAPPASFYVLGTVPSIVRCWLTTNFAHGTLLYADVCTGSQKSTIDYSLVQELDLLDEVQRDVDGSLRIRLNVYFAEAVVAQHVRRSSSPERPVPSMTVLFELIGLDGRGSGIETPGIRIYIGSDALRAHSADILFSQNTMVLYGDDRARLRVPFVRPEDDATFRYICTTTVVPEKPKLNANAAPFISGESCPGEHGNEQVQNGQLEEERHNGSALSSPEDHRSSLAPAESDHGTESDKSGKQTQEVDFSGKEGSMASESSRRESSTGIWGSWRQGNGTGDGTQRENRLLSGYQPAVRGGRGMKVLKPQKSTSSARTGGSYEAPPPAKGGGEGRRKSGQANSGGDHGSGGNSARWDAKPGAHSGNDAKSSSQGTSRESRNSQSLPRSANPVGGASAFSWMAPPGKPKSSTSTQ